MRRKLTTLRAKQGHTQNGAPRQLIDECLYREFAHRNVNRYDSEYSGWSNASRPRDQAITPRPAYTQGPR